MFCIPFESTVVEQWSGKLENRVPLPYVEQSSESNLKTFSLSSSELISLKKQLMLSGVEGRNYGHGLLLAAAQNKHCLPEDVGGITENVESEAKK